VDTGGLLVLGAPIYATSLHYRDGTRGLLTSEVGEELLPCLAIV
jgi:hypothetical protein